MSRRVWGILLLWALALAFALTTGRDLAYNLLYFISGMIVVSFFLAWSNLRGLGLSRSSRALNTQVGKYFEESLELSNSSIWPKLWVEVRDLSQLPGHGASRVVTALARRGSLVWQARTFCAQRGRFRLGPVVLTSGDPLGLFRFHRPVSETHTVLVYPATFDLSRFSPPTGYMPGGEMIYRRTPFMTANVSGIREYAPGDSFNRIHWASTARAGRLISREFELDPLSDVWIFLDMHEDAQAEQGVGAEGPTSTEPGWWLKNRTPKFTLPPSTVEYGVTVAASLAQHYLRLDRAVGFLSYSDRRQVLQPDRGERQLDRLLEILAVIGAGGRIPISAVLAGEGRHVGRQTTLVVITPSTDRAWIAALRGLRARGVQGVAVLLAARSFGPAADWQPAVSELQASGLTAYLVRNGDDLPAALSRPVSAAGRRLAI